MAIAAFSENDKRKNLNPVERARAIEKMIADFGWTQQEVAERLQIDRSSISNSLRMLRMPAQVLIAVAADVIPVRSAMALLPYYELTPLELNALEEHFPESADSVSLFRSGMINSDAIRKTISIWMDYLHPNVEQIALPEQNDQPVFVESASEVQATDLPEETPQESNESEIAPIDFDGEPVDDNSNLNEPVNNQTEESLVFSPSGPPEGETPAAYGQRMSRVAGELIKSGKDETPENMVAVTPAEHAEIHVNKLIKLSEVETPAPVLRILTITWNEDNSAQGSYKKPDELVPQFFVRSELAAVNFQSLLAELGIE